MLRFFYWLLGDHKRTKHSFVQDTVILSAAICVLLMRIAEIFRHGFVIMSAVNLVMLTYLGVWFCEIWFRGYEEDDWVDKV